MSGGKKKKKVTCIILAGGTSSRFGEPKQLARVGAVSMLQRAIDAANSSSSDYVVLVLGWASELIAAEIDPGRANLAFNKEYSEGLSRSIKTGIANTPEDSAGALFMVADQPLVSSEILDLLIERFNSNEGKGIAALAYRNDPRNPIVIDRRYFAEIEKLEGDRGAKELVLRHMNDVQLINVENPKIFLDVDTKDNLQSLNNKEP